MKPEPIDAVPGFAFWREACHVFAKNVYKAMTLAGNDKVEDFLEFLWSLPLSKTEVLSPEWQQKYCNQCLKKAWEKTAGKVQLVDYFGSYFPDRNYTAQSMLIDAFAGFITGIDEAEKELKEVNH